MEGRDAASQAEERLRGRVGDGGRGMRREKERAGKKSRARRYYGGLAVFGVGWRAKYRVQGPAAGPFGAQAPLQQARALQ